MKTNSNSYIFIYSTVLVLVVAFLLAFVYQALKPAQDANVALDKKKQILASLNIRDLDNATAAQKYAEVVVADQILDEQGNVVEAGEKGGEKAGFQLNSADYKAGKLAFFVCNVNGEQKYVIPVYGMGLWGAISGYISLNSDKQTVCGAYFNHDSETAGLGAEIKDNTGWQQKFAGKKIFKEGSSDVALSVEKKPDDPATQVDGITGATLTCNGVRDMLKEGLGKYTTILKKQ